MNDVRSIVEDFADERRRDPTRAPRQLRSRRKQRRRLERETVMLVDVFGSLADDADLVSERSLCVSQMVHGAADAVAGVRCAVSRDVHQPQR